MNILIYGEAWRFFFGVNPVLAEKTKSHLLPEVPISKPFTNGIKVKVFTGNFRQDLISLLMISPRLIVQTL
jgi:hypothetical protein